MSKVSVIIPTCNKSDYLSFTLASFTQSSYINFEIVVVDDGSTDDTKSVINSYSNTLNMKYIYQPHKGRATARNVGIENAVGEIVIFNDDDRLAHPDFIAEHVKKVSQDPKTVVVGWKKRILTIWSEELQIDNADLLAVLHRRPTLINEMSSNKCVKLIKPEDLETDFDNVIINFSLGDDWNWEEAVIKYSEQLEGFVLPWIVPTESNMSAFKGFIVECGMHDENYQGWGMEDTDLNYRLYKHGAVFRVNKSALNFHQIHPVNEESNQHDLFHNLSYFCNKYDSLEAYLYWRRVDYKLDITSANEILKECSNTNSKKTYEELKKAYRELQTIQLHSQQNSKLNLVDFNAEM